MRATAICQRHCRSFSSLLSASVSSSLHLSSLSFPSIAVASSILRRQTLLRPTTLLTQHSCRPYSHHLYYDDDNDFYNTRSSDMSVPRPYPRVRSTTILTVRKGNDCVVIGDGQMSAGSCVAKDNVRKVRLLSNNTVICGFAGSTADCMTLFELLEKKLSEFPNQLLRSAVELAKMWRTDKMLRNLQARIIVVDSSGTSLQITGEGDVISEDEGGIIAIGSGGEFARSAARALITTSGKFKHDLSAREIALRSMVIAADICVYTNKNFFIQQFRDGKLVEGEEKAALEKQDKEILREMDEWRQQKQTQKELQTDAEAAKVGAD